MDWMTRLFDQRKFLFPDGTDMFQDDNVRIQGAQIVKYLSHQTLTTIEKPWNVVEKTWVGLSYHPHRILVKS